MGRIFKFLGNTPVSFDIVPKQIEIPKPAVKNITPVKASLTEDKFISTKKHVENNPIIKMRNGFGKLMAHFSKVNNKI